MISTKYILYNAVGIPLLKLGVALGPYFNQKIRDGVRGRKDLFRRLEHAVKRFPAEGPRFWIHNSSMGEFEQAKPVISLLKERFHGSSVVVSFFSPSGYRHVQNYREADHICYLPLDTRRYAERFIDLIDPTVAIVVRHDFWPNHLHVLSRRHICTVLINCSVRSRGPRSAWPGLMIRRFLYGYFDSILTVSHESKDLCRRYRLGSGEVEVAGDTRYDQVVRRAKEAEKIVEPLRAMQGKKPCFVAGSTWPADEIILFEALSRLSEKGKKVWLVLVPHEPSEERTRQLEYRIAQMGLRAQRYSTLDPVHQGKPCDVLIVDRMGILASLYALGQITYVGGGFGVGIHNVLEPAALGKPVIFGPNHKNSHEAVELQRERIGFAIKDSRELTDVLLNLLDDSDGTADIGDAAARLVHEKVGASQRIVDRIERIINDTC